ncbi:16S rRNA (uracil(1498)-N(3))-methyltransferase [Ahrensia sp. 13_GOM-1096m]|uniref:16S rRNA (uracil(1498)-N(3))-methyltransferase n=1 Tax=Ahrensia sp. 13_GOM-1096m TaxID=1380380 RepID=UPI00047E9ADB|nr:16S rRNA (uracil(1498)-N(3))-methyltransferase [Ahrensia sp. 13_GOM-1096m]
MRANYKIQRLFLDVPLGRAASFALDKPQANYLANVLRMKTGDKVLVFNGKDGEWLCEVEVESKRNVSLMCINQEREQPQNSDFTYCFAPLKVGRLDYMAQKAVEMGASLLQPVLTQHTQNHRLNIDKMNANALEAAEQCGILNIPQCAEPIKFEKFLDDWDESRTLIFCDEDAQTNNPVEKLQSLKGNKLGVLIGPEGGFSDDERAALRAKPFVVAIPLGSRILRADTAAVAAMAVIQAVAGDW